MSVTFCRGGAFTIDGNAGTRWVNDQCQAAEPCIVRDDEPPWGSGDEGRPIVHATGGANAFALEDGGDANHEEGYVFLNLDLRGSGDGQGFFIYNDMDDVLICNVSIDGFSLGVHAAGSNPPEQGSDHVSVSNAVHYAGSDGGWACFRLDLATSAYAAVDHNLCFFPAASGGDWVDGEGDLGAWPGSSSLDGSSIVADPSFSSISGPGFDLSASSESSPMVDAGHPSLSAATDIAGANRDGQPDMGAHEW